jgi:carbon monoxide dehydrogenase subunit G
VVLRITIIVMLFMAIVLAFAATKSKTFRLRRSISIKAAPDKVFALVNDLHKWNDWSAKDNDDPNIQRTFGGAAAGEGAVSVWHGSGKIGAGRMLITESIPNQKVSVTVDFVKPFTARNVNVFTLEPAGDSTNVTWDFTGAYVYVLKVMSVFVSMDRIMGKHFETGLENLKRIAER